MLTVIVKDKETGKLDYYSYVRVVTQCKDGYLIESTRGNIIKLKCEIISFSLKEE